MSNVKCPECGARAVLSADGLRTCQGPTDATDEKVMAAERALKLAMSQGVDTKALDDGFRALTVQKVCGKVL